MTQLDPLSSDARQLLDAARSSDDPTDADRARVRLALAARLGAAGAAGAAGATAVVLSNAGSGAAHTGATQVAGAASLAVGKTTGSVVMSWATKVIVGLAMLGGGLWVSRSMWPTSSVNSAPIVLASAGANRDVAPANSVDSVARVASDEVDPAHANEPADSSSVAATPTTPSSESSARSTRVIPPASPARGARVDVIDADALEGDVRQLSEAQRAMQQGDTDKALALLDSRNSTGPLAAERAGAKALALCQAGRREEGARVAAQFLRAYPSSPLAARVRAACSTPARQP